LALVFFADLALHPTQTLYSDHSDLLALHLPSKRFLVQAWQENGELPLWCPYVFSGSPFIHDVQVSAFYPPELALYLLPARWLGPAMSWLLAFHVIVAGWCMYAYAREQALSPEAALVAAIGYMFAGKWMGHLLTAGHYNMIPLAWLPLVLLLLERALARNSGTLAVLAGAAFSLIIVCAYPYMTLYAGVFAAIWSLGIPLTRAGFLDGEASKCILRLTRAVATWLVIGMLAALTACALAAIQLLPAIEASGQSSRVIGLSANSAMLAQATATLWGLVGPPITAKPEWEFQGQFGLLWICAAAMAPFLCQGLTRFRSEVCLGVLVFSLGGAVLLQDLPGFNLFRLPSRGLLVAAFPISLLVGVTTQVIFIDQRCSLPVRCQCRHIAVLVSSVLLVMIASAALARKGDGAALAFRIYWPWLVLAVPFFWWLLVSRLSTWHRRAWIALLVIDSWLIAWPLVEVRPDNTIYSPSQLVQRVKSSPGSGRTLDRPPSSPPGSSGPLWPGLALVMPTESTNGFNPLDIRRYKQYLQFISGEERPLTPLRDVWTYPMLPDFPIVNKPLLDLLGVKFVMQPRERVAQGPGDPVVDGAGWRAIDTEANAEAFDMVLGGIRSLPVYVLYENRTVFPRAFFVKNAMPMPSQSALQALAQVDLRRTALLEELRPDSELKLRTDETRIVTIEKYTPNRISLRVGEGSAGYLILADIWYPGWTCSVDGQPVALYRADFLFRGVAVPAGTHEVDFIFSPSSYRLGMWISWLSLGLLAAVVAGKMRPKPNGNGRE
jgi:hypothetical protein